jgi:serine/threonine protein kinase
MDYKQKWIIIADHDGGGQGKVYRVCKKNEYLEVQGGVRNALERFSRSVTYGAQQNSEDHKELRKWLPMMLQMEDPANQFALKVLHKPQDARDPKLAKERIKREIAVMRQNLHPNLIEMVDSDPDDEWFVSKFYPGGTLAKKPDKLKGDFLSVLKAVRPIIEGVAKLHKAGYVHRDIKPANIFVGTKNELVLGDFGLVFFEDAQHTRASETYENVGSRDWMPGWAMGMRIDEIKPTFDVFSLGKVLWAMTSGQPILQLWYFDRERFNVEKMFPGVASINFANPLFGKCIVEEEKNCLPDAVALLNEIDKTISAIESNADRIDIAVKRKCKVCGLGEYKLVSDENDANITKTYNFGIHPTAGWSIKIFSCTNCGNVQLFSYNGELPPAWQK